jgi:hypothetical protein
MAVYGRPLDIEALSLRLLEVLLDGGLHARNALSEQQLASVLTLIREELQLSILASCVNTHSVPSIYRSTTLNPSFLPPGGVVGTKWLTDSSVKPTASKYYASLVTN